MPQLKTNIAIKNSGLFFYLICVFYLLVAFKSSGYHQEDEHFQIIEFANYKLGLIPDYKLAWEFPAQIRPTLQPAICFALFKLFGYFNITNGYDLTLLLRILTAIFSLATIRVFINQYKVNLTDNLHSYFVFISYLLWFIPFISVRFSSETLSGLCYIIALTLIQNSKLKDQTSKYFLVGTLLGFSILFRYQSGLLCLGIFAWLVYIKKLNLKTLLTFCLSIVIILAYGILIDKWFYGEFVLSIYNYFYVNLVEGVSSRFGVSPWYEIVLYIIKSPGPIGILIFLSFWVILRYHQTNLLLWSIIPFLIVHSIIPHKELRFLFPIAYLVPYFLVLSYQTIMEKMSTKFITSTLFRKLISLALIFLGIVNFTGLIAISTTSAGRIKTSVTEYIDRHYPKDKINLILFGNVSPYIDWDPLRNSYYNSFGISKIRVNAKQGSNLLAYKKKGMINLLIIDDQSINEGRFNFSERFNLVEVYQNIPLLTKEIFKIYNPDLNNFGLRVYEFTD